MTTNATNAETHETTPDPPPDEVADAVDALGRRAGLALRRPLPGDALQQIARAAQRRRTQQRIAGATGIAAVVALAGVGIVWSATRGDDPSPIVTVPTTIGDPDRTTPATTAPPQPEPEPTAPDRSESRAASILVTPVDLGSGWQQSSATPASALDLTLARQVPSCAAILSTWFEPAAAARTASVELTTDGASVRHHVFVLDDPDVAANFLGALWSFSGWSEERACLKPLQEQFGVDPLLFAALNAETMTGGTIPVSGFGEFRLQLGGEAFGSIYRADVWDDVTGTTHDTPVALLIEREGPVVSVLLATGAPLAVTELTDLADTITARIRGAFELDAPPVPSTTVSTNARPPASSFGVPPGSRLQTVTPAGLVVSDGTSVTVFDLTTGALVQSVLLANGPAAVVSADGRRMFDGTTIWDLMSGTRLSAPHVTPDGWAALSDDGALLYARVAGSEATAIFDTTTGNVLVQVGDSSLGPATFSPDGRTLATSGAAQLRLWDVETGELLGELPDGLGAFPVFTADSAVLLATGDAAWFRFDARTSMLLDTVGTMGAEFAGSGRVAVNASTSVPAGVEALLFDAVTGALLFQVTGQFADAAPRYVSPDARLMVVPFADGSADVIDLATGISLMRLTGHDDIIDQVLFLPDSSTVVTHGVDGTVNTWLVG